MIDRQYAVPTQKHCMHAGCSGHSARMLTAELAVQGSGKLEVLQQLLDALEAAGKRTVIAVHASLAVLSDYLRLQYGDNSFYRVDEETAACDRAAAIDSFNRAESPRKLMVLEVASCSLGTDLTGADAVIVYDSDGHPSGDIQRFGCARNLGDPAQLLIFRLYCSGTLEEVIVSVRRASLAFVLPTYSLSCLMG
jgi:SNF2 family DNA or RNA helicase